MRGYVLSYRPGSGSGTVVAESGRTYPFSVDEGAVDLRGGDLVRFRLDPGPPPDPSATRPVAREVELLQAATDRLRAAHDPLFGELYRTVLAGCPTA